MYQITEECTGCGMCRQWCPVKAIRGHKKKRHVIESQCISCGVCGRVCGYGAILDDTGCLTRRLPIREWFKPVWDYLLCNGCGKCAAVCPVRCIQLIHLGEGVEKRPILAHPNLCIGCQFCKNACESRAIRAPGG